LNSIIGKYNIKSPEYLKEQLEKNNHRVVPLFGSDIATPFVPQPKIQTPTRDIEIMIQLSGWKQ